MRLFHRIGLVTLAAALAAPVATASAQSRFEPQRRPGPAPAPRNSRDVYVRFNAAYDNGFRDGYDEGLSDGRKRHRNAPYAESRYRNGDRGYDWRFGRKDVYRVHYRDGFESGYERGFREGSRDGWRRW